MPCFDIYTSFFSLYSNIPIDVGFGYTAGVAWSYICRIEQYVKCNYNA
jgi:hypothetical protein